MIVLLFLLLVAVSLLMLLKPELLWKLEHILSVRNGEPTELYLAMMRIGGAVLLLCGIIATLAYLIQPILG